MLFGGFKSILQSSCVSEQEIEGEFRSDGSDKVIDRCHLDYARNELSHGEKMLGKSVSGWASASYFFTRAHQWRVN